MQTNRIRGFIVAPMAAPLGCLFGSLAFSLFFTLKMGVLPGLVKEPGFFLFSSIYAIIGSYLALLLLMPFILLVLHKRFTKLLHAQMAGVFFGVGACLSLGGNDMLIWSFGLIYAAFIAFVVATTYWWIAIRPEVIGNHTDL